MERTKAFIGEDGFSFSEGFSGSATETVLAPASEVKFYFGQKGRSELTNTTGTKKRKYYHDGEIVLIKQLKVRGTIVSRDIRPEDKVYKATVKYVSNGNLTTREFDLWDIDKVEDLEANQRFNRRERPIRERRERKPLTIKVKYFDDATYFGEDRNGLEFIQGKSDWIDLRSSIDVTYQAGDFIKLPLGVAMELPQGFEAHVAPRSSSFKNFGTIQTNSTGVVDESYKGDNDQWFIPLFALRSGEIRQGDRVCQFRIVRKMDNVNVVKVDVLGNEDRGGHGSSGKN